MVTEGGDRRWWYWSMVGCRLSTVDGRLQSAVDGWRQSMKTMVVLVDKDDGDDGRRLISCGCGRGSDLGLKRV